MAAGGGRLAASARRLIIRKTSFVSTDRWSDCFLADAPEQPAFLVRADSGGSDPGIEVLSQAVMAGRPRGACHPSYATAANHRFRFRNCDPTRNVTAESRWRIGRGVRALVDRITDPRSYRRDRHRILSFPGKPPRANNPKLQGIINQLRQRTTAPPPAFQMAARNRDWTRWR